MEKVIMQEKPNKSKKKRKVVMIVSVILAVILLAVIGIVIALKVTVFKEFPELKGEPETGNWYRITPEDAKSSDGSEWHGFFRKGSENKVVVYFFGGGVSIDEYTAAHGGTFYAANCNMQDFIAEGGIGSKDKNNPFKDWTFLVLPYSTGDFHSGTGEFKYTDNGKEKTLYHNGYNNYSAYLEKAKQYVGSPDTLLVTGFSAGGFAASLLADDVIGRFPSATNVTVCVDSSLILYDKWKETATDMWRSPTEIAERLTGNNLVLDSLIALHEKHGNSVKILFDCSVRDITLSEYQAYIREGAMSKTKANGDIFQEDLKAMVEGLQKNIEGVGIYVWEYGLDKQTQNTQHTIISDNAVFKDKLNGGKSIADWMFDAVNGNVKTYGLDLLDKKY